MPRSIRRWTLLIVSFCFAFPSAIEAEEDSGGVTGLRAFRWLRLGAQVRGRSDFASGDPSQVLSRTRVSTTIESGRWIRTHFELQDGRNLRSSDLDNDRSPHVRHAWMEFGRGESAAWTVRAGRQSLSFGDERLIGSDEYWCNRGRQFDAVSLTLRRGPWSLDVLAGKPVGAELRRDRVGGVFAKWKSPAGTVSVEPYHFWVRNTRVLEADAQPSRMAIAVPGMRITVNLPGGYSGKSDVVFQRGRAGGRPVRAWGGVWEAGMPLAIRRASLDLTGGYSHASGGSGEGRYGTFSDLYPASYNDCGLLDPFAWRNLRDAYASVNWKPGRRWRLTAQAHQYWLASAADGAYVDEQAPARFEPGAMASKLGTQVNVLAGYRPAQHWEFSAGFGRFFAGAYWNGDPSPIRRNLAFVASTWTM
jgi:hypothetical protein